MSTGETRPSCAAYSTRCGPLANWTTSRSSIHQTLLPTPVPTVRAKPEGYMRRRDLIAMLGCGIVILPHITHAQQAAKVYRIGFLFPGTSELAARRRERFREQLLHELD